MARNYHINMDSFGSNCPANWHEIAAFLNTKIDKVLESLGSYAYRFGDADAGLSPDGQEAVNQVWEDYCNGDYASDPDFPGEQFD